MTSVPLPLEPDNKQTEEDMEIPNTEKLEDEFHIRIYGTEGALEYEASPDIHHQIDVDNIRNSLQAAPGKGCVCFSVSDVPIKFGPQTWRRPDVSIWCKAPELPDRFRKGTRALLSIPDAIVEVVSESHPDKDRDPEQNPKLYLSAGVKDVLIYDPRYRAVMHYTPDGVKRVEQPYTTLLRCGCMVTI